MLSSSFPTLNAMIARTFTEMPCPVTQVSWTSASRMASDSMPTRRSNGFTKAPWPTTTRNGTPLLARLPPEISMAWSAAGTRYPNISHLQLMDIHCSSEGPSLLTSVIPGDMRKGVQRVFPDADSDGPGAARPTTRTVAPLGSGAGDQAMKHSSPLRNGTITSPRPACPRVAMVRTPMLPTTEMSPATGSRSSYRLDLDPDYPRWPAGNAPDAPAFPRRWHSRPAPTNCRPAQRFHDPEGSDGSWHVRSFRITRSSKRGSIRTTAPQ